MLEKPRFKYHFHVVPAPDENVVYLLSEKGHSCLRGYLYRLLAPFLDGTHLVAEIIDFLKIFAPESDIRNALLRLEAQGYLVKPEETMPETTAAFWNLHGIDAGTAKSRVESKRVSLHHFGQIQTEDFRHHLYELGIQTDDDGDVAVVLTDDYLQEGLSEFNRKCLQMKKPWLLVKPVGSVLWIGPVFVPDETGCWQCLAHRLKENRTVETFLQYQRGVSSPFPVSHAMLPATFQAGCSLAATQVALWVAGPRNSPLRGGIITVDVGTLEMHRHLLAKRPQCPVCGIQHQLKPQPLLLQSRKKKFTEDGGHRIYPPAETFKRCRHLISPISGIVSEIKPVFTDASGLISIYCGVHRVSIPNGNFKQLQASLRNNSTGKGKSELQSRVSAFSEAVERYCAVYQGDEFRICKSVRQMDENFIPLEECMLFSETQYCKREEWNRENLSLEYVPVRLDPEKIIDWTPVWSFQSQAFKYVPTAYCYLRYNDPSDIEEPFYNVDSNGLAAGNVLEEAILQGFFEVIERDALSIWWYNRLERPSVDLDSFHNSYFDALREYYLSIGREFWVLDLTTDSTIPTCVAISRKTESDDEALTFGCGTHFDAGIAVSRALTEMNQALYLMESGRIAEHAMSEREQFIKIWNHKGRINKLPYLAPDPQVIPIKKGSFSEWYKDDLRDDLERCFEITQNMGLELLVHDLTQPDIKLNVVKVIVPGLRQIRARFASGRLYDVPVRQGWVNQAIAESELNPITFWI